MPQQWKNKTQFSKKITKYIMKASNIGNNKLQIRQSAHLTNVIILLTNPRSRDQMCTYYMNNQGPFRIQQLNHR